MRFIKTILAPALMSIAFVACQQNEFKIVGTVEGLNDGDTLILTTNMVENTPLQKAVVANGTFEMTGKTDSVQLCAVFVGNRPDMNAMFFLEPGTIKLHLAQQTQKCTVEGTKVNEAWQQMNNMVAQFNGKMQKLAAAFNDPNITKEEQGATIKQLRDLEGEMAQKVIETAEKNIDNELGVFILTHFENDEQLTPKKRADLIEKMPASYRQRDAVKMMEQRLATAMKIQKGSQIEDFTLNTPEGLSQSVMDIVKQNKLTILDFWASWCGPCRQEMPNMVNLYKQYQEKGLAIIGISLDEDRDSWVNAIKSLGMTWPQISDLKGWNSSAAQQFQVRAIPHVIVLDSKGIIVEKDLRGSALEELVQEALE